MAVTYTYEILDGVGGVLERVKTRAEAIRKAKGYRQYGIKARVKVIRSKNPIYSLNDWVPCHAIRMTPQGIQVLREKNPSRGSRQRNVEMGFRDNRGIFHPIRASSDYDEEEVGERLDTPRKRTRRKATTKKKATKKKVARKSRKRKR